MSLITPGHTVTTAHQVRTSRQIGGFLYQSAVRPIPMTNRLDGVMITYTRVHDEPIRRCTDDRSILDSLRLGAYRVLAGRAIVNIICMGVFGLIGLVIGLLLGWWLL